MYARSNRLPHRRNTRVRSLCGGSSSHARCAKKPSGGHLELVSEFEVMGGGEVHPHSHPTFEFYYVLSGSRI